MSCKDGLVFSILLAIALTFAASRVLHARFKTAPRNSLLAQTATFGAFGVILAPMVVLYIIFCGDTLGVPIWCEYRPVISLLISFPLLMLYEWVLLPKLGIDPHSFAKTHLRIAFDIPISMVIVFSVMKITYGLTDSVCRV